MSIFLTVNNSCEKVFIVVQQVYSDVSGFMGLLHGCIIRTRYWISEPISELLRIDQEKFSWDRVHFGFMRPTAHKH